ncbi:MAG: cobalt-precorrin-5B (C(1))-methyltransferase [Pseudomonadota bacterium]
MGRKPDQDLRRGWTTGACAAAAAKAACVMYVGDQSPVRNVQITLPRGETPTFAVAHTSRGDGWIEAGITKDAGDDPDVTHGALVISRVFFGGEGIRFQAGDGVGHVTKPGLPIAVGEPAINPVPRQMIADAIRDVLGPDAGALVQVSIPGGAEIAQRTWNPRLGIQGGLSILGTTGIVRPFSCAAWIASIHRGIDVARADGLTHVAGCTGATSEATVQAMHGLPDHAMLDMGDFAGGMLKYLARHPVEHLTIGGGIGKLTKLAQGATDLHSSRSQVDFADLAQRFGADAATANTALDAYGRIGAPMADWVAVEALKNAQRFVPETKVSIVVIDRAGAVLATA